MNLDEIVARCRHDIDILTASFGSLSKTEIGTLVLSAHLDGQCDALEDEDMLAASPEERAAHIRSLRAVADRLHEDAA